VRARQAGDDDVAAPPLFAGMGRRQRFGTLPAALHALGIRGWPRRLRWPLPEPHEVLAAIRRRYRRGDSMRQLAVWRGERRIVKGAVKHFGTWRAAMKAAGLGSLVGRPTWTKAKIVAGLKARYARGAALNMSIVENEEPSLAIAAANHFGNMRRALLAAKLPVPARLRTTRREPGRRSHEQRLAARSTRHPVRSAARKALGTMSEQEFQRAVLRVLHRGGGAARPGKKNRGS